MTYAHSHQTITLPRIVNGSASRHFADFVDDYTVVKHKSTIDVADRNNAHLDCNLCSPYGTPVLACSQHGYIFSRDQYDTAGAERYYMDPQEYLLYQDTYACWRCLQFTPNVHCTTCGQNFDPPVYAGYDDNYGYLEADLDEVVTTEHEINDFYDSYLYSNVSSQPEPWWRKESTSHDNAKRKRAFRQAISRSDSHRQRDLNAGVRGRFGGDSRRYSGGVTPRNKYFAMKEAAI